MIVSLRISPFVAFEASGSDISVSGSNSGYGEELEDALASVVPDGGTIRVSAAALRELAEWADCMVAPNAQGGNPAGAHAMAMLSEKCQRLADEADRSQIDDASNDGSEAVNSPTTSDQEKNMAEQTQEQKDAAAKAEAKAKAAAEKKESAAREKAAKKAAREKAAAEKKAAAEAEKKARAEERANRPKKVSLTLSQRKGILALAKGPITPKTEQARKPLDYFVANGLATKSGSGEKTKYAITAAGKERAGDVNKKYAA